jgi:dTDP-4-dehydrorhamnose 3,5-epimerase
MDKIILSPLKVIDHVKGDVMHALKKSDDQFSGFGEAYFTKIHMGKIKGWKKHLKMTMNLIVPIGNVKIVVFNESLNIFQSFNIGDSNYKKLTIPPGYWVAFRGLSQNNIMLNIANIEHDPEESINLSIEHFSYEW